MPDTSTKPTSVITGGSGFLGSHLSDRLLAEGHRVIAVDNLITGNTANIEHLAGNQDFKFIRHDVTEYIFIPGKVDYVWHFASPASPIDYLNTHIVRIFNTYGPRMRLNDGRVVPAFIGQALTGEPMTIFGDGTQTRSFCYVSDLIDGIFRLMMSDFHEPVNIGNPREMTISEFGEEIRKITGTKSQIEYKPLPVDDPKVRQPNIDRARKVLGWEPKVDFDKGIRETIEYFRPRV